MCVPPTRVRTGGEPGARVQKLYIAEAPSQCSTMYRVPTDDEYVVAGWIVNEPATLNVFTELIVLLRSAA